MDVCTTFSFGRFQNVLFKNGTLLPIYNPKKKFMASDVVANCLLAEQYILYLTITNNYVD